MANEVTLPENHKLPDSQVITEATGGPESTVKAVKPEVQLTKETALKPLQVGGNNMAEVDTGVLSSEHGAIRHDIGLAEANIRDKVGSAESRLEKGLGDNRYTIANEARALAQQIGGELNGINAEIGAGRREVASGFADTRYNVATGFADTRYNVATGVSDIRREAADHTGTLQRENMKGFDRVNQDVLKSGWSNSDAIKDARYDINSRVTNTGDRVVDRVEETKDTILARSWDMGRDIVDNRTQLTGLGYQVRDGFFAAAKDSEINALKTQVEIAKQSTYLSDKIDGQAEKTRDLINCLKEHDLNRMLVERNAELVEERHHARHWRVNYDQSQFANLTSQLQAFQSQLAETRQGMVNFGTMAGVGQTSTANNVR